MNDRGRLLVGALGIGIVTWFVETVAAALRGERFLAVVAALLVVSCVYEIKRYRDSGSAPAERETTTYRLVSAVAVCLGGIIAVGILFARQFG